MSEEKNHKTLVVFMFETGSWDFLVDYCYTVVDGGDSPVSYNKICSLWPDDIDMMDSDYEFEDYVRDVLDKSGYAWEWVIGGLPRRDGGIIHIGVE